MARRTEHTHILILHRTKLSETDLIIECLAEDGRQIRAVAKGARKPGSRFSAACELFCIDDALIAEGRNLALISDAKVIQSFKHLMEDYDASLAGQAALELARACSYEDAPDSRIYPMSLRALEALNHLHPHPQEMMLLSAYILKVLSHVGYQPDVSACAICGEEAVSYIDVRAGGLVCSSCVSEEDTHILPHIDEVLIGWIKSCINSTFDVLEQADIDLGTANALLSFAHDWAVSQLEMRIRSLEFLRGVGAHI